MAKTIRELEQRHQQNPQPHHLQIFGIEHALIHVPSRSLSHENYCLDLNISKWFLILEDKYGEHFRDYLSIPTELELKRHQNR